MKGVLLNCTLECADTEFWLSVLHGRGSAEHLLCTKHAHMALQVLRQPVKPYVYDNGCSPP